MGEITRPGYYAVIPADVRYDDRLPANAKLLYGEISALIGKDGFCYASNQYFMDIYGMSDGSITRLITKLESCGYIKRELEKDKTGQVVQRRLYLSVSAPEEQPPIIFDTTSHQNCGEGGIKNEGYINLSNTNKEKIDKKEKSSSRRVSLDDKAMQAMFVPWIDSVATDTWTKQIKNNLWSALVGFYQPRESKKQTPAKTAAAFTILTKRLRRFSGDDPALMVEMLERATMSGWRSVYPIGGDREISPPAGRRDEEWL